MKPIRLISFLILLIIGSISVKAQSEQSDSINNETIINESTLLEVVDANLSALAKDLELTDD